MKMNNNQYSMEFTRIQELMATSNLSQKMVVHPTQVLVQQQNRTVFFVVMLIMTLLNVKSF